MEFLLAFLSQYAGFLLGLVVACGVCYWLFVRFVDAFRIVPREGDE